MVNKEYLQKELEWFLKDNNAILTPKKYNKDVFTHLFEKYDRWGMCEYSYCCDGLDSSCWTEVVEEGNWGLTLSAIKANILRNIKSSEKYLYNGRKYGNSRLHMYEDANSCYIYVYLRDKKGMDYAIWFDKESSNPKTLY